MNYSFTTPQDGNLTVRPIPPDVIYLDDLARGDGYYVEGQFGVLLSWQINAAPYLLIRNDYTIEEQSFLHYRADTPALQVIASLYGDMHFILEGVGDVHLRQGQFNIFYLPQPKTTGVFEGLSRLQTFNLYFPVDALRELMPYFPLHSFIAKIDQSKPALLFKQAGWVTTEILTDITYMANPIDNEQHRAYLFDKQAKKLLVLLMMQKYATNQMHLPPGMFDSIMEARHTIETHVGKQLFAEDIAAVTGITANDLKKYFKVVTGKSLMEFITMARLNNAKLLLQQTDKPIKEIAAICGYDHESNFIIAFQRMFGYGPSFVRRRNN